MWLTSSSNAPRAIWSGRSSRRLSSSGKTAVVLSAGALLDHEDLIELAKQTWRPDRGAHRRADRPRRRDRGGGRNDPFGPDGHPQAARGLAGAPYVVDNNIDLEQITEPLKIFDGTRTRGGTRISGQCERCRGAVAGRDRSRPNDDRDLGRSHRDAQHAPDRGRIPIPPAFRWQSKTSRRRTRRRAASPRSRSSRVCASCVPRFASGREHFISSSCPGLSRASTSFAGSR